MSIRGARGANRLDFFGRVGRKALRPGVYVLSLTRASRRAVMRPLLVQVFSPRRTVFLGYARLPRCDGAAAFAADSRLVALAPEQSLPLLTPVATSAGGGSSGAPGPTRTASPQPSTPRPERDSDVLGVDVNVPAIPQPEDWEGWQFGAALLLVGLPLLLMLALVVRFVRGTWNP